MTAGHVLHPKAQDELEGLVEYFLEIDPRLGVAFQERYREHLERVKQTPELFRERKHGVRRVNLAPRFEEYFIAYLLWREQIVIVAVGHGKRRPYYFRDRIDEAKCME